MVKRCSWHSTVPSTSPSIIRSSRAKIWPLMVTFLPKAAVPAPRGETGSGSKDLGCDDMVVLSLLGDSVAGVFEPGAAPGRPGCSSVFGLVHIAEGFSSSYSTQSYYSGAEV